MVFGRTRRRCKASKIRSQCDRITSALHSSKHDISKDAWEVHEYLGAEVLDRRPRANQGFVFSHDVSLLVTATDTLRVEHLLAPF